MTTFVRGPLRVRVPATSANLGPGFDALGLALALHDEVSGEVVPDGLSVEVIGEGADAGERVACDETHLVVRAMRRAFMAMDVEPTGLAIRCENRIPHSRGLGSSSAAICAGVVLARSLVLDGEKLLAPAAVLELANDLEGHPDNVAPCLAGGLTIAWIDDGTAHAVRREVDRSIVPVALVPPFTTSTEIARGLLPATVAHRDAAFTAGRAALLVAALTGSPQALFAATEDKLHQSYRAPAMTESAALVTALRSDGLPAVISGAGPTVLVLARDADEAADVCARAPHDWRALMPGIDAGGAVVVPGPRHPSVLRDALPAE